jgi:hypothetical protein
MTAEQAMYLRDILDLWIGENSAITNEVIVDRIHATAEEMLESVDGMHKMFADAVEIKMAVIAGLASA